MPEVPATQTLKATLEPHKMVKGPSKSVVSVQSKHVDSFLLHDTCKWKIYTFPVELFHSTMAKSFKAWLLGFLAL